MMDDLLKGVVKSKLTSQQYQHFLYMFEGGKRIRPQLIKNVCDYCKKPWLPLKEAMAAVEVMHCASLIHDDIIDKETERRGKEPFYKKFGEDAAILYGDLFLTMSFGTFLENYKKDIYTAFVNCFREITEGQLMETHGSIAGLGSYLGYIRKKTASLFRLCAEIPLLYHRLDDPKLLEAAMEFGLLFQILDDLNEAKPEKYNIRNFASDAEIDQLIGEKKKKLEPWGLFSVEELIPSSNL